MIYKNLNPESASLDIVRDFCVAKNGIIFLPSKPEIFANVNFRNFCTFFTNTVFCGISGTHFQTEKTKWQRKRML